MLRKGSGLLIISCRKMGKWAGERKKEVLLSKTTGKCDSVTE
jgi:hypothetical protein